MNELTDEQIIYKATSTLQRAINKAKKLIDRLHCSY